jgi:glycine cleavage system regulatory protein
MKKESLVMTLIGKDRPGLVASLSAIIDRHGGNWEESRMVELEGEFAGLLHVGVAADRAGELERALGEIEGMTVTVARAPAAEPSPEDTHLMTVEVIGQDHPGIVHHLSEAIAARGINIEELTSELKSAPMAGGTMFQATARLRAPKSVRLEDLQQDLEAIADDLMVDIDLEKPD